MSKTEFANTVQRTTFNLHFTIDTLTRKSIICFCYHKFEKTGCKGKSSVRPLLSEEVCEIKSFVLNNPVLYEYLCGMRLYLFLQEINLHIGTKNLQVKLPVKYLQKYIHGF